MSEFNAKALEKELRNRNRTNTTAPVETVTRPATQRRKKRRRERDTYDDCPIRVLGQPLRRHTGGKSHKGHDRCISQEKRRLAAIRNAEILIRVKSGNNWVVSLRNLANKYGSGKQ